MIHPSAIVDADADIAVNAEVGPYAVIGAGVRVGARCRVGSHVVLEGPLSIGEDCKISSFACIGAPPQDLKYAGEKTSVQIGARCTLREFVTVHRGTATGDGVTTIGDDALIMAYAHIAHDCRLGDRVVLANSTTLAGHVVLDDDVMTGGMVAFHQFVHVGRHAFIAASAMVERDVPPFCRVFGDRAKLVGLNALGLKRRGFSHDARSRLSAAYKALFRNDRPLSTLLEEVSTCWADDDNVQEMVRFVRESQRGICR